MFKRRPVRLYGAALKRVCAEVYERDHGQCVNCGHAVPEGTKPHHVVFKSKGGGDTADNMAWPVIGRCIMVNMAIMCRINANAC